MQLSTTSEESITQWLGKRPRTQPSRWLRLGIGDDCAVLRPASESEELLVTTDQLIENKHFLKDSHPAGALGRKLLARGLSDLAAMGAAPAWFLVSLGLPDWVEDGWLEQFFKEMFESIETYNVSEDFVLAGGDLSSAERFTAHITACGTAPAGRALTRAGASEGDLIYVSGELGGSALGLEKVLAGVMDEGDPATDRHLRPTPRLALGVALREAGATAAMDLSDGLSSDLSRLARASGLRAQLDLQQVPVFEGASRAQALHGGEEYELLFTAPAKLGVPDVMAGSPITRIGEMQRGEGVFSAGDGRRLGIEGFDHFGPGASSSS